MKNSNQQHTRELLGWCENEDCGLPIYAGTAHTTVTSEKGNTYIYCRGCQVKARTPDEEREED